MCILRTKAIWAKISKTKENKKMRLLFELDAKNYNPNGQVFERPSVRSIIINDGKIAMVYSKKYNYYKFPGGGIEKGETHEQALLRETLEEAGLVVIKNTIKEYGYVRRVEKYNDNGIYIQNSYYYLCKAQKDVEMQHLDAYEEAEGFTLVYIQPEVAIKANRGFEHGPKSPLMIEREARVLEFLIKECYF
jgi:8-oxo-dGTP pyrophosphatase MutT (NUDIX family)